MNTPGRPKGTKITFCTCGRRVAGELGKRTTCQDCGKRVTIRASRARTKGAPKYLSVRKTRKAR